MKRFVKRFFVALIFVTMSLSSRCKGASQERGWRTKLNFTAPDVTASKAPSVTVTVRPDSMALPFAENLIVVVKVSGGYSMPIGTVVLSGGGYTSAPATLNSGSATFYVAPGSLAKGADTLTATYTPDSGNSLGYKSSVGMAKVTVTSQGSRSVKVYIDTLANRHQISPYIYGINTTNPVNISGLSPGLVRFGGNEASNYNWKSFTYNAGGDWFYEDFVLGDGNGHPADSVRLTSYAVSVGSHMLTTMPMLNWVAKENGAWSYSVTKFGRQCRVNPNNSDAGDGKKPDCKTRITTSAVTDAYYPLVDTTNDCTKGKCIYRDEWAKALAAAFGGETCAVPYSPITSCHFYDMDNEPEIWDGSHGDVHPTHAGYADLANIFEKDGGSLKKWDPQAVRFGPITCCWNFYWTAGRTGDDKSAHAGIDFLPWWLNQIHWLDEIDGARTLDVFDLHAYVGPNVSTAGYTDAQLRAAAGMVYRTYWDPTYYNKDYDAGWMTTTEPDRGVTFIIPRLKAMVNAIYPGTPLSFSEWESFLVPESEWDFATALSDADAFGVMGREGLSFSTRWGGPDRTDNTTHQLHPNFQGMNLYTNYDGAHHRFGTLSVLDQSSANANLFDSFAALDTAGTTMTIMILNKDPNNTAYVTFHLNGFKATAYKAFSLVSTNPGAITSSASTAWSARQTFAPYSITLLVVSGSPNPRPAVEWYLNPDDLMIPASGKGILRPKIESGTARVKLTSAVFDEYEGAEACRGKLKLADSTITSSKPATIIVSPGSKPGFCHYTVAGDDGRATQTEGGWIVVENPAGTLRKSGDRQTGTAGYALVHPLKVTFHPGKSGLLMSNAEILFTASAGALSNGTRSGSRVIATTNSSGVASVTLTLPPAEENVTVTAQDQFAAGGTTVTFKERAR